MNATREIAPRLVLTLAGDRPYALVCFEVASFLRHGAEAVRATGVRRLSLSGGVSVHMPLLVKHAGFLAAEHVTLGDLDDHAAKTLGAAALPSLRELSLFRSCVSAAGVRSLLGGAWVPKLRLLDVSESPIGDDGARAIGEAPLSNLQELALRGCHIEQHGAAALGRSTQLRALLRLLLGGDQRSPVRPWNAIGDEGARALASAPWIGGVELLTLQGNCIGPEGGLALARMAKPGPVEIDLRENFLDDSAAQALANADLPRLRRIGLSRNALYGSELEDFYDYDGTVTARGPRALTTSEISERHGFARRGIAVG